MASLLKAVPSQYNPPWETPGNGAPTVSDWRYADDHDDQVFDLYVPRNGSTTCPLLVFLHGGGGIEGNESPTWMTPDVGTLIRRGIALASVRYRLAPGAHWDDQLRDVYAAVRELLGHASNWRLWDGKYALWGPSWGGFLTSLAGCVYDDPAYRTGSWPNIDHAPTLCVADCPPTDFLDLVQYPGFTYLQDPGSYISQNFGAPVLTIQPAAILASPARQIDATAAAMWVRHGTADPAIPIAQSRKLRDKAVAAGISTSRFVLTEFPGAGHVSPQFYTSTQNATLGNLVDGWIRP